MKTGIFRLMIGLALLAPNMEAAESPLNGLLRTVFGPFVQNGARMNFASEQEQLLSRLQIVFREVGIDPDALRCGAELEIYNVHPQTEDLRSVVVLKQTRRGLRVAGLARNGVTVLERGRRQVRWMDAIREIRDIRHQDLILKKQIVSASV